MANINPASRAATSAAGAAQTLPMSALTSPYDGTSPTLGATMPLVGQPIGGIGSVVPQLTGLSSGRPQVNATNQTAIANGDVNQHVTNSNQYTNKYYNIVVPNGGLFGGWGGVGGLGGFGGLGGLGGWGGAGTAGNTFIDPATGVVYVHREPGVLGWLKRLLTGY